MIINVICPSCGKKIQVDDSNDANICILCGKPFVTANAKSADNNETVSSPTSQPKNDEATHLYNNIKGLAYIDDDNSNKAFKKNSEDFILNYPLDNRTSEVNFYIAYKEYIKVTKCRAKWYQVTKSNEKSNQVLSEKVTKSF